MYRRVAGESPRLPISSPKRVRDIMGNLLIVFMVSYIRLII